MPKITKYDAVTTAADADQVVVVQSGETKNMTMSVLKAYTGGASGSKIASWDITTSYVSGDLVNYGGTIYRSIQTGSAQVPDSAPAYWTPYHELIKLDDLATPDDNTDLNVSTTAHGLAPKLSNVVTEFLNGQGGWTAPGGDVTAAAVIADNAVVRGDGGAKGVQSSSVTILDSGRVGINQASPNQMLDVDGIINCNNGDTLADPTTSTGNGTRFSLGQSLSGNAYGNGISALRNGKYDIWYQVGDDNGGGFRWYKGATERMTIDYLGNVGIGTSSPDSKLHISSGTLMLSDGHKLQWGSGITCYIEGSADASTIEFTPDDTEVMTLSATGLVVGDYSFAATNNISVLAGSGQDAEIAIKHFSAAYGFTIRDTAATTIGLDIVRHNNDATGVSAMFIDRVYGYVGIGTSSPSYKLTIGGTSGTDEIGIYHDETDAHIKWTDGELKIETDEGTNTDTVVSVSGKGTGIGYVSPGNVLLDDALSSDHSTNGTIIVKAVGESVVFGDALYFDWTDKEYKKADADAATTMPIVGIALETKADGETCKILVHGWIRDDTWAFAASTVYASTTGGGFTTTAPSGTGDQVQVVGHAYSADILFFSPSPVLVEVA